MEITAISLISCRPLKTTWGSGERRKHLARNLTIQLCLYSSFSDSHPTHLRVEWDSSLNMHHQMCHNGAMAVVHVEAVSQPHRASSHHHPTQRITQTMQTASTQSLSPLALSSCWIFSAWICRNLLIATLVATMIILRSEMALQLIHLSWANYVAVRSLLQSSQVRTICGWSEEKYLQQNFIIRHIKSFI